VSTDHWMTFGTFAEQAYFTYPSADTYSGVIINANMVAHAPAGIGSFLAERTSGLKYIIDPMTHAFQHSPTAVRTVDGRIKSSIEKIALEYGQAISGKAGRLPLLPRDFSDDGLARDFVANCLSFQRDRLSQAMAACEASKYLDPAERSQPPYALVSPYFYMTESGISDWLPLNRRLLSHSVAAADGARVFACLTIDRGLLCSPSKLPEISNLVGDTGATGALLWIDSLADDEATSTELDRLVELSRLLRKGGASEVISLHGGYFSTLLCALPAALTGVAHGPEYGESRPVVPVGGGIPIARYYMRPLHQRTKYRDALMICRAMGWLDSAESFHRHVCNCQLCRSEIAGDISNFVRFGDGTPKDVKRKSGFVRIEFPATETKIRCLKHYLNCKSDEFRFARNESKQGITADLEESANGLRGFLGDEGVRHLERWRDTLERCWT
jgi:hypothetical protein